MHKNIKSILDQLDNIIDNHTKMVKDERLSSMLKQCFRNTLETTVKWYDDKLFIITGDIPAMWLRDSSAQVKHYIPFANEVEGLAEIIESLISRQIDFILHDPYANAFNNEPNKNRHKDRTDSNSLVWERKYEIDSLCYPIWLAYKYHKETGSTKIFTENFKESMELIINTFIIEQNHRTESSYYFERENCPPSDTLKCEGLGTNIGYTGMTWSGFRPSDDACKYGYLVPANMMASVVLGYMDEIFIEQYSDKSLSDVAKKLRIEINEGIKNYGTYKHPEFGEIYAYETDGLGNYNLMDDANVPSLLSAPYLGFVDINDPTYQNTRRFILSKSNPYYYEGIYAKGVGSPHTPEDYIWHISLAIQGLTSVSIDEKETILKTFLKTDACTGFMHEGFNVNNPKEFTREWFAWANSIFSEFTLHYIQSKN